MNKEKIANIIYNELSYMYCDNCRYATELANDPDIDMSPCDDCHRKYNSWGISMAEAERIAEMIGKSEVAVEALQDDWIPLDDDSAAPGYKVICQDRYENIMLGYAWVDEYGVWVCEDDNEMMDDVIAWRPLPAPYKEKK